MITRDELRTAFDILRGERTGDSVRATMLIRECGFDTAELTSHRAKRDVMELRARVDAETPGTVHWEGTRTKVYPQITKDEARRILANRGAAAGPATGEEVRKVRETIRVIGVATPFGGYR